MSHFGMNGPTRVVWNDSVPEARGGVPLDPDQWLQLDFAERIGYAGAAMRPLPADMRRPLPGMPAWTVTFLGSPSRSAFLR